MTNDLTLILSDGTTYEGRGQYDECGNLKREWATCGTCGFTWNDALITELTPAPAGRCPNEYNHPEDYQMTHTYETKLARTIVRTMLEFGRDDEDFAVNGFDRRNRERLVRVIAKMLNQREDDAPAVIVVGEDDGQEHCLECGAPDSGCEHCQECGAEW